MQLTIPNPVFYSLWIDLNLCDLRKDARFHPDDETDRLGDSLSVKQLVPIIVCRMADPSAPGGYRYEVVAGVGRVLAARKKNWNQIRADVYEGLEELQKLDIIFTENEDRKNASPLYQALVLRKMQETDSQLLNQNALAEKIGKTQANVSQYLSLLNLAPQIFENINTFIKFGLRHFMQLLRIENKDAQWKLAQLARDKGVSSTELQASVDQFLGVKSGGNKEGRPKGDKTLSSEGYAFKRQKGFILLKGRFEEKKGIALYLAKLGECWEEWSRKNPQPRSRSKKSSTPPAEPATSESVKTQTPSEAATA